MMADSARRSRAHLDESVRAFLKSSEGKDFLASRAGSAFTGLVKSIFLVFFGFIFTAMIFLIWPGIKWLWKGLTLEPIRNNTGARLKTNVDSVQGLICVPIMSGPGDPLKPSLLVASFSKSTDEDILSFGRHCFDLYSDEVKPEANEVKLVELLKDDIFTDNRRRAVPQSVMPGQDLWLFDSRIDPNEVSPLGYIVCAATPGKKGDLMQLPLSVLNH